MGVLWSKSGSVEFDNSGAVAAGAKAYFFQGGTTTPASTYSDAAESSARTHPVLADANGRWPNVFIPYQTSYDVQVTTSAGTQLYYPTNIPNADPIEASEDSVDDNQLLQTGDVIWAPKTGDRTGFVRLNGRTIGSASSGATERANDDCEDLFLYYWNNLANGQAAVGGGRGASAAADWAANKTIALLNGRSASLMGLDDMGNSAAGLLPISGIFVNGAATTVGSLLGENTHTMTEAEIRAHTHTFSGTTSSDGAHTHTGSTSGGSAHSHTGTVDSGGSHTHTGTTDAHSHTVVAYVLNQVTAQSDSTDPDFNALTNGTTLGTSGTTNTSNANVNFTTDSGGSHNHTFTTDNESSHTHTFTTDSGGAHTHTYSGTTSSTGSSTAFNTVHRSLLGTWYQKL
jgi:hypothetical protein